jgi:SNF2 family DNA or RNA helicase
MVKAFQAGGLRVLSGTVGAMGVGLTLTASSHCVFIDRDWNPAINKQAEDRVCRIGQTKGVIITDIISDNSTDKLVTAVLNRKLRLLEATFGV